MQPPPAKIGEWSVLQWTQIDSRHRVTGACQHFNLSTDTEHPTPSVIAIVRAGEKSFYLMRFNENWQFITDTWHESLEEACYQAESEYEGVSETWQAVEASP